MKTDEVIIKIKGSEKDVNEAFVLLKGLDVETEIMPCIKAKALRKNGTNEWYQSPIDEGLYHWWLSAFPEVLSTEANLDQLIAHYSDLPSDAELIEIEILLP